MSSALTDSPARPTQLDAAMLARLRFVLLERRRFRLDQLAEIQRSGALRVTDEVARDVTRSLAAGARSALTDICDALRQMQGGRYGICRDCHAPLQLEQLEVLPHITRCASCLQAARSI